MAKRNISDALRSQNEREGLGRNTELLDDENMVTVSVRLPREYRDRIRQWMKVNRGLSIGPGLRSLIIEGAKEKRII